MMPFGDWFSFLSVLVSILDVPRLSLALKLFQLLSYFEIFFGTLVNQCHLISSLYEFFFFFQTRFNQCHLLSSLFEFFYRKCPWFSLCYLSLCVKDVNLCVFFHIFSFSVSLYVKSALSLSYLVICIRQNGLVQCGHYLKLSFLYTLTARLETSL